jgi:hypothetical protein
MLRRERTQAFVLFTHRSEILQFPMQPCSYSKNCLPNVLSKLCHRSCFRDPLQIS